MHDNLILNVGGGRGDTLIAYIVSVTLIIYNLIHYTGGGRGDTLIAYIVSVTLIIKYWVQGTDFQLSVLNCCKYSDCGTHHVMLLQKLYCVNSRL